MRAARQPGPEQRTGAERTVAVLEAGRMQGWEAAPDRALPEDRDR